jgi:predicted transcriptional regulator
MTTMISIASLISAIAAAVSAYFSCKNSKTTLNLFEKEKYEKLKEELNKIIEISIKYPYVESKNFTSKWLEYKESDDEQYLRYDMYCNRFYNHLHNVCEHFDYDKQKIEDFVDVKSWIRLHKLNWQNPVDDNENIDGYDKPFRDYINSYLI